jgi:hypothetical protein
MIEAASTFKHALQTLHATRSLYAEKFRQANPALGVEIATPGARADDFAKEFHTIRSTAKGSGCI